MLSIGVIAAFAAFLFWGFGDFLIQRATRRIGDWETLFFITLVAAVVLLPFVYDDLRLFAEPGGLGSFIALFLTAVAMTFGALFDFEALKEGKISIVEPVLALELPVAVALSAIFLSEIISPLQLIIIGIVLLGIVLVSVSKEHIAKTHHRHLLERGVILAGIGSLGMGLANFMVGFASRATGPLMVNWFISVVILLITGIYLFFFADWKIRWGDIRKHIGLIAGVSVIDNLAWISYATAAVFLPIGIATGISESYIALAALLGVTVNGERLTAHQKIGVVLAIGGAVALGITAS